jgi:hypothetical protein
MYTILFSYEVTKVNTIKSKLTALALAAGIAAGISLTPVAIDSASARG